MPEYIEQKDIVPFVRDDDLGVMTINAIVQEQKNGKSDLSVAYERYKQEGKPIDICLTICGVEVSVRDYVERVQLFNKERLEAGARKILDERIVEKQDKILNLLEKLGNKIEETIIEAFPDFKDE